MDWEFYLRDYEFSWEAAILLQDQKSCLLVVSFAVNSQAAYAQKGQFVHLHIDLFHCCFLKYTSLRNNFLEGSQIFKPGTPKIGHFQGGYIRPNRQKMRPNMLVQ